MIIFVLGIIFLIFVALWSLCVVAKMTDTDIARMMEEKREKDGET